MSTCPAIPSCCDSYLYGYELPSGNSQVTTQLQGLLWILPCTGSVDASICSCPATSDDSTVLNGLPGRVYNIVIRIRGVVELYTYLGGTNTGYWNNGGTTDPGDPFDNIYQLTVSNPAQSYFLNYGPVNPGGVYLLDYEETIQVASGATVDLFANSQDGEQYKNLASNVFPPTPITIYNDDLAHPIIPAQPYDGQFIQLDALSATLI